MKTCTDLQDVIRIIPNTFAHVLFCRVLDLLCILTLQQTTYYLTGDQAIKQFNEKSINTKLIVLNKNKQIIWFIIHPTQ